MSKMVQIEQIHSLFCLSDTAAPSLSCSKSLGGRTVAAAASKAANEVVVEPTNVSFAIFIVFDMKRCNYDEINSHYGHFNGPPNLEFNRQKTEAEGGL